MPERWKRGCRVVETVEDRILEVHRVTHRDRPGWLIEVPEPYETRAEPSPPPHVNQVEVYDESFGADASAHQVFARFDGLSLRTIADEHYRLIGQVNGAPCPECAAPVTPYRSEFGIQVVCEACGGMFAPEALPTQRRASRVLWGTPLWHEHAIHIAASCARALHHGHLHGASFRGLNNQRVIAAPTGAVRVLPMSVTLEVEDPTGDAPIIEHDYRYLSPECCRGLKLTAAHDVYAVGAMLYEMTVGQHPAETWSSDYQLVKRVRDRTPRSPAEMVDGFPAALDAIIVACLAHDTDVRPDMGTLIERLETHALDRELDISASLFAEYLACLRDPDDRWLLEVMP